MSSPAERRVRHEEMKDREWPVHHPLKAQRSEPLTVDGGDPSTEPTPLTMSFTTSVDTALSTGWPTGFPYTSYSSTFELPEPSSTASYDSPTTYPTYPTAFPPTTLSTSSSQPASSTSQSQSSSSAAAVSDTAAQSTAAASSSNGMSSGALAAAIVVPILAALAVLIIALFCCIRRRKRSQALSTSSATNEKSQATPSIPPVIVSNSNNEGYYTGIDTNISSRASREIAPRSSVDPPPPYKSSPHQHQHHSSAPEPTLLNTLPLPERPTTARSTSAASITSTLYSDAASIHSARAARMSVGAADMVSSTPLQSQHKRSASGSVVSDPFKSGSEISDASGLWAGESNVWDRSRSEGVGRRSSEILSPERVSPLGFEDEEVEGKGKAKDMR